MPLDLDVSGLGSSDPKAERGGVGASGAGDLLVGLVLFASLGAVLPVGAAPPMGDAWSYAWSARELAEHGVVRLTDFQAMTLVGQLWLTRPFTWVFSAEPAFLNLLTFCFSGLTAGLFFGLLRAVGTPRGLAWLAVGVLVFNPTYLAQSMTYDTEIYFLFASLLGALAFTRWQQTKRLGPLWLAGIAFALAVLIRQHAITFPLAAGFAVWWSRRREDRSARAFGFAAFGALALTPLALLGFYAWLHLSHGVPKAYTLQQADLVSRIGRPAELFEYVLRGGLTSLHYLAIFTAPLLPALVLGGAPRRYRLGAYATAALVVGAGTGLLWLDGHRMPYLPIGPLHQVFLPLRNMVSSAILQSALTCLSTLLSVALLGELVSRCLALRSREASGSARAASIAFLASSAALLLGFTVATGLRFERHLVLPLPFLIASLLGRRASLRAIAVGWIALVPPMLLSLHFVDQRVRAFSCQWETAKAAMELGYAPFSIDGGFAFNGYYSYPRLSRLYDSDSLMPWPPDQHPRARILVGSILLPDDAHELLERHPCPNRPGLPDFEFLIIRRPD